MAISKYFDFFPKSTRTWEKYFLDMEKSPYYNKIFVFVNAFLLFSRRT
jgi:hypothetical protein